MLFATRLLRAKGNLKLVQVAMAHEGVATTSKYAHVDTSDIRGGMLKVQNGTVVLANNK